MYQVFTFSFTIWYAWHTWIKGDNIISVHYFHVKPVPLCYNYFAVKSNGRTVYTVIWIWMHFEFCNSHAPKWMIVERMVLLSVCPMFIHVLNMFAQCWNYLWLSYVNFHLLKAFSGTCARNLIKFCWKVFQFVFSSWIMDIKVLIEETSLFRLN